MRRWTWVVLVTGLAAYLRFVSLDGPPLWIDEAMLGEHMLTQQEYVGNLLVAHSDFWLRFPYALAGTLTVPAFWWVTRKNPLALYLTFLIAVFPLFVFWSRMARPYALAGLFLVLGWRSRRWWWWMHGVACLSTPVALVGVNPLILRWWQTALLVLGAAVLYLTRGDVLSGKNALDIEFILKASRLWYLPALALLLWVSQWRAYVKPR